MRTHEYSPYQCLRGYRLALAIQVRDIVYSPLMAVERLVTDLETKELDWASVAQTFDWKNIPPHFIRAIALKIHDKEYSHHIMLPIIALRTLHLEDYAVMAPGLRHLKVKWEAKEAVFEASKMFSRLEYGRQIFEVLYPPTNYAAEDYRNELIDE